MAEKKKSVYSGIADDIIEKIRAGKYPIGTLLPPERELMSVYSVQRTTVRRGLDILSGLGYINKVAGLGSVVKSSVPVAAEKTSRNIKVTKNEVDVDFSILLPKNKSLDKLPSLAVDMISHLENHGVHFMTSDVSEIKSGSGIIAVDCDTETDADVCLALCQSDERRSVIPDNDKGAYVALSYLEELGHKKIAFIGTQDGFSFENAAYDSFCTVNSFLDQELINLEGADEKSGFDGFSELFRRHGNKFTAVCTVNDEVAKGVLKATKYYKLNVPSDISVISLCSSNEKCDIDAIFYNPSDLAEEVIQSAKSSKRISTVLFGGSLKVKGTCESVNGSSDSEKNMSDFLL